MDWKVAVLGCGNWGNNLIRNFCRILGPEGVICHDLRPGVTRAVTGKYPGVATADDIQVILDNPAVAAVAVATPSQTHYSIARDALLAGKHVFVEKPLATCLTDAEALCRLAEEKARSLMVDHLMLYHPAIQKLTDIAHAGELGEVQQIYGRRTNLGVVRSVENVLWSLGPHDVATMISIIGEPPSRVIAHGGSYLQPELGIHDVVFVTLTFPGGQVGNLHLSWLDPRKVREMVVVGSRKMAVFDDMEPAAKLRVHDKSAKASPSGDGFSPYDGGYIDIALSDEEPLYLTCKQFLQIVESGRAGQPVCMAGLEVMRVLECARRSLDAGGVPVELSPPMRHG